MLDIGIILYHSIDLFKKKSLNIISCPRSCFRFRWK